MFYFGCLICVNDFYRSVLCMFGPTLYDNLLTVCRILLCLIDDCFINIMEIKMFIFLNHYIEMNYATYV